MKASVSTLYRILEEWWQTIQQGGIPAAMLRDQVPSGALPPATGTDKGGVILSDTNPAAVGTAAPGTATPVSRRDHVHAHGNQAGGSLHSAATTSVAGFQSAADKTKEDAYPAISGLTTGHVLTATGAAAVAFQAASGMTNPMTTQDDIIIGGSSGTPARLAKGSDSQVLTVDPSTHHLVWATPSSGLTNPMTTEGDLIRGGSSGTPTRVAVGASGKILTSDGTDPVWGNGPLTTRGDIITAGASGAIGRLAVGAANRLLRSDGTDPSWGQVVEADLNLTDLTTADVATTKHGFAPKLPNDATKYLDGTGAYSVPSGAAATYPSIAIIWHDTAKIITGNGFTFAADSNQQYNGYAYQNAPANGDVFEHYFLLTSGTYTFEVFGITANSRGKVDWTLDGGAIVSGQDWYSAGLTYNIRKTNSVTVSTSGAHTLRGTINGKNASSTLYQMLITRISFHL